jgi:hypothetical protein
MKTYTLSPASENDREVWARWRGPISAEMRGLMDTVAAVGQYPYNSVAWPLVAAQYAWTAEEATRGGIGEAALGSVISAEIYAAGERLRSENHVAALVAALQRLDLQPGKKIGALNFGRTFGRSGRFQNAVVVSISADGGVELAAT